MACQLVRPDIDFGYRWSHHRRRIGLAARTAMRVCTKAPPGRPKATTPRGPRRGPFVALGGGDAGGV